MAPPQHVKTAILKRLGAQAPRRVWGNWLVGFGAAVALGAITLAILPLQPTALRPSFEAQLVTPDGTEVLVAGVIPATHEIVIAQVLRDVPEDRSLQLWLIKAGDTVPIPLGLIARAGETRIVVPDEIAPGVRTGTLAISDEPFGGSPTGQPTGDVIATGTFNDI